LSTLSMSTLWEVSMAFKPPRTVFLDFPLGCPAGKPNEPEVQREILRAALAAAPEFSSPWKIRELPFQWSADGRRDWEEEVKEVYRKGLSTVSRHVAEHQAVGESLLDQEKEFSLRCNC
jgi:D-proline reductase (dithiol) PrdB